MSSTYNVLSIIKYFYKIVIHTSVSWLEFYKIHYQFNLEKKKSNNSKMMIMLTTSLPKVKIDRQRQ